MKTLLFAPMWLDAEDRLTRNLKWLDFYTSDIKEKLGINGIFFVDNASSQENIDIIKSKHPDVVIHRCTEFMPRASHREYPYWYRAFRIAAQYAQDNGYDKIVHIDTDVYVLSDKICTYIKSLDAGWNTFWCARHNFPESTFQIIGKDKIQEMKEWMTVGYLKHYPCDAENVIPFTNVNKSFKGDRYGETNEKQKPDMAYYCQCPNEIMLNFNQKIRVVGTESRKTYLEKTINGFFNKYMPGHGCEIGYAGYTPDVQPILEQCDGYDLSTPGYDGKHIPVANEHYNWVYSSHALEHIEDYKQAINEWMRVIKPGGHIVTVVPHRDLYEKKLTPPSQFNGDHKRFYTSASLLKEFEDSLPINSYRVRHLRENDEGHDYTESNNKPGNWGYEIELVIQKL